MRTVRPSILRFLTLVTLAALGCVSFQASGFAMQPHPDAHHPSQEEVQTPLELKLIEAARNGDIQAVNDLTGGDARVDDQDDLGRKLLNWAARKGAKRVVSEVLARFPMEGFGYALELAAEAAHREIVSELLANPHVTSEGANAALRSAARGGHREIVSKLLVNPHVTSEGINAAIPFGFSRTFSSTDIRKTV